MNNTPRLVRSCLLCEDCTILVTNDELGDDDARNDVITRAYAAVKAEGHYYSSGSSDSGECDYVGDDISHAPCDCCRTTLGGSRYAFQRVNAEPPIVSMSWGTIPAFAAFRARFEHHCPNGNFDIRNCKRVGDASFDCEELFREICDAMREEEALVTVEEWDREDSPGNWASAILGCLGFEWI